MVSKRWTVEIGGTPYKYEKIDFTKTHPSQDPDTFYIKLSHKQSIDYFAVVEIEKDNVNRFYGFVEKVKYSLDESGVHTHVSGRCRKVIPWKKWTERFTETKEKGPEKTDGTLERGFFGKVYPHELFKFLVRTPKSDNPTLSLKHKIGYGLISDGWNCCVNNTAAGYHDEIVRLRRNVPAEIAWRGRGDQTILNTYTLNVNNFVNEESDWVTYGASPWLDTSDTTNRIYHPRDDVYLLVATQKYFTFQTLAVGTGTTIQSVLLKTYDRGNHMSYVDVYVYDGSEYYRVQIHGAGWGDLGYWKTSTINVTSILDTATKINNARVYFVQQPQFSHEIAHCYLTVVSSSITAPADQRADDYFIVDLNNTVDRICGAYVESRLSEISFARNYTMQYTTLSDCCADNVVNNDNLWSDFTPAVNITDNEARDILHSWEPQDGVHCIRMKLTLSANNAWEISQIYIYQADEADYTVTDSTLSPNITLDESNIADYVNTDKTPAVTEPFNLPFARLTNNLNKVVTEAYTSSYTPYEWWIDNDGEIHFGTRRGSDESGTISFVYGTHFSDAWKSSDIKQTGQRGRVIGKGEGRRQDEIASDWVTDTDAMDDVNTFYEFIESEKTISDKTTAIAWANVYLQELKDIIEEIEVTIENDPYDSGSWDVGDDVTLTHPLIDVAQASYRIKRVHTTVDESGEIHTVTVTNSWEDVTDRIANIYKKIRELELSSSYVDDWSGEGAKQSKIEPEEIEDIWSITSSNKWFIEVPEEDKADPNFGTLTAGTSDYSVDKDEFEVHAGSGNPAQQDYMVLYLNEPQLSFSQNPRFSCEFEIDTSEGEDWQDGDSGQLGIFSSSICQGFGFTIEHEDGIYKLYTNYGYGLFCEQVRIMPVNGVQVDVVYQVEARMLWDERVVEYYFGSDDEEYHLVAIMPLESAVSDYSNNRPMLVSVNVTTTDTTNQAYLVIHRWRTQAEKQPEMI